MQTTAASQPMGQLREHLRPLLGDQLTKRVKAYGNGDLHVELLYGWFDGNGRGIGALLTGTQLVRVKDGGRVGPSPLAVARRPRGPDRGHGVWSPGVVGQDDGFAFSVSLS